MRARTWFPVAFLVLFTGCGSASGWDPVTPAPAPLELPDGMDSRDPAAYYNYGQRFLEHRPAEAADAFYWASRLDPTWASPVFARRMALLMADPAIFERYMQGKARIVHSPGARKLDSLYLRALTLNPFPRRSEEARAIRFLFAYQARQYLRRTSPGVQPDPGALGFAVDSYLRKAGPETRAWIAYSEGRYGDAITLYRRALDRHPDDSTLRADLARALFFTGQYAPAGEEMARTVELLNERDEDELVRIYESKALYHHSIGLIRESQGDTAGARESYAMALQEDLSYYTAHMRLADLALTAHDTTTALSEMALATEIRPDDPAVRYLHGRLLNAAGMWAEAETELRAAVELEPMFAAPYRALARALERQGRREEAAAEYAHFLEKAHPAAQGVAETRAWLETNANGDGR